MNPRARRLRRQRRKLNRASYHLAKAYAPWLHYLWNRPSPLLSALDAMGFNPGTET